MQTKECDFTLSETKEYLCSSKDRKSGLHEEIRKKFDIKKIKIHLNE